VGTELFHPDMPKRDSCCPHSCERVWRGSHACQQGEAGELACIEVVAATSSQGRRRPKVGGSCSRRYSTGACSGRVCWRSRSYCWVCVCMFVYFFLRSFCYTSPTAVVGYLRTCWEFCLFVLQVCLLIAKVMTSVLTYELLWHFGRRKGYVATVFVYFFLRLFCYTSPTAMVRYLRTCWEFCVFVLQVCLLIAKVMTSVLTYELLYWHFGRCEGYVATFFFLCRSYAGMFI
jgi:hypothetical protein